MKFFDLYYLEIFDEEPDFQIDEVLEISERLTYYKDDFREVWLDNNRNIVKEQRYKNGNIFYLFESNKIEDETEHYTVTLFDKKGRVTNSDAYKRPKSMFFKNSIFYENNFEEIIITDEQQNIKAQILKINHHVYLEKRFSSSYECDFYFLGVKKRKTLKSYDEDGKLLLKEFYDEKGFNTRLFQYKILTEGYMTVHRKCFLNDRLKEEKTIIIQIKTT